MRSNDSPSKNFLRENYKDAVKASPKTVKAEPSPIHDEFGQVKRERERERKKEEEKRWN